MFGAAPETAAHPLDALIDGSTTRDAHSPDCLHPQAPAMWPTIAAATGSALQELCLDNCRVSEAALLSISQRCQQLRTLSMVACRGTTTAGLQHLLSACCR